jgi:hypothetical protein
VNFYAKSFNAAAVETEVWDLQLARQSTSTMQISTTEMVRSIQENNLNFQSRSPTISMGFVSRSAFCECDVELGVRCLKVN